MGVRIDDDYLKYCARRLSPVCSVLLDRKVMFVREFQPSYMCNCFEDQNIRVQCKTVSIAGAS